MYCNTSYPPHGVLKRSRGCQSESRATPAGPSPTANQLDTGEPLGQDEFRLTTIHTLIHHRSGEMTILGRLAAAGGGRLPQVRRTCSGVPWSVVRISCLTWWCNRTHEMELRSSPGTHDHHPGATANRSGASLSERLGVQDRKRTRITIRRYQFRS